MRGLKTLNYSSSSLFFDRRTENRRKCFLLKIHFQFENLVKFWKFEILTRPPYFMGHNKFKISRFFEFFVSTNFAENELPRLNCTQKNIRLFYLANIVGETRIELIKAMKFMVTYSNLKVWFSEIRCAYLHSHLVVFEDIEANELKILIFTTVFEKLQIQRELFAFFAL